MSDALAYGGLSDRGVKPLRTCVSCGRKAGKSDLFRVVCAPDGAIVLDWSRKLPGRGAHVCATRRCIEAAVKGRRFDRTLKSKVRYSDPEDLLSIARIGASRQFETLVRSGIGGRLVATGVEMTDEAIGSGKARCLLVASDCTSREALTVSANRAGIPVRLVESKERLGALAGRSSTGALAVLNGDLARALVGAFDRIESLG